MRYPQVRNDGASQGLERRYAWLMERIDKRSANEEAFDRDAAEAVALRWILDEYARLTSGER